MKLISNLNNKIAKTILIFLFSWFIPYFLVFLNGNLYQISNITFIKLFSNFSYYIIYFQNKVFPVIFFLVCIYEIWTKNEINFLSCFFINLCLYNFLISIGMVIKDPFYEANHDYELVERNLLIILFSIILSFITIYLKEKK